MDIEYKYADGSAEAFVPTSMNRLDIYCVYGASHVDELRDVGFSMPEFCLNGGLGIASISVRYYSDGWHVSKDVSFRIVTHNADEVALEVPFDMFICIAEKLNRQ